MRSIRFCSTRDSVPDPSKTNFNSLLIHFTEQPVEEILCIEITLNELRNSTVNSHQFSTFSTQTRRRSPGIPSSKNPLLVGNQASILAGFEAFAHSRRSALLGGDIPCRYEYIRRCTREENTARRLLLMMRNPGGSTLM